MKEKSIFHDLYYGKIIPWERGICKDPEYLPLNKKISKAKEYFKSMMSEEDYKRLEALENMYGEASDMESVDAFAYGFRLAVLLMFEVFNSNFKPEKPDKD